MKFYPSHPGIRSLLALMFSLSISVAVAQQRTVLTLDTCIALAHAHYPLIKQYDLLRKSSEFTVANIGKGFLPQWQLGGQATYQSAVPQLPNELTGRNSPLLAKDQYKLYAELNQPITDGFVIKQRRALAEANAVAEEQAIEVEMYGLNERVQQVYFGILLADRQLKQTDLVKADIASALARTRAAIEQGTALKSNAYELEAELLNADQRAVTIRANRQAYVHMLEQLTGRPIEDSTHFTTPMPVSLPTVINRPELRLFEAQQHATSIQEKIVGANNTPRLSVFFQGAYGRPTLNFLTNQFDFYYIGGVRLSWNLSTFYTSSNEKQIQQISRQRLAVQRETFLFNTELQLTQQVAEIDKIRALRDSDEKIIALREKVKETAMHQLENGTITPTDFIGYVNAEDQARQNLLLHQTQLLMAQYQYKNTSGN